MPLTVKRLVRAIIEDEREHLARYADLLQEELRSTKEPRLLLSDLAFLSIPCFITVPILWLLTLLSSKIPIWIITAFWGIMAPFLTVWSWWLRYHDEKKLFRRMVHRQQQRLDRISQLLDQAMLTTVHVSGSDFEGDLAELGLQLDPKNPGFSPQVGDDVVFLENDVRSEIWIVDSKGKYLDSVREESLS